MYFSCMFFVANCMGSHVCFMYFSCVFHVFFLKRFVGNCVANFLQIVQASLGGESVKPVAFSA